MNKPDPARGRRKRKKKKQAYDCCCCLQHFSFCWTCACGFQICQGCMDENAWGLTCNHITWVCPDCGEIRVF